MSLKVTLIACSPEPEKLIAASAKLCYSDSSAVDLMNGLTDEKTASFVEMLANIGLYLTFYDFFKTISGNEVEKLRIYAIVIHRSGLSC